MVNKNPLVEKVAKMKRNFRLGTLGLGGVLIGVLVYNLGATTGGILGVLFALYFLNNVRSYEQKLDNELAKHGNC